MSIPQSQIGFGTIFTLCRPALRLEQLCRIRVRIILYVLSPIDKKSFTLFICLRSLDLNSFRVELLRMSISNSFHNLRVDGMNEVSYEHKRKKGTSK